MTLQEVISSARRSGPVPQEDGTQLFEFEFGPEAGFFKGHFPGRPLLPGVFQLEMARLAAEWTAGNRLRVREIAKAKFQRPIGPGETVTLKLKWGKGPADQEHQPMQVCNALFSVSGGDVI